jgi:hypothetical protein
MLNKKTHSDRIKSFSIGFISLLLLLDCYSDSKQLFASPQPRKLEYICGEKCFSIDQVWFEFKADKDFVNDWDRLSAKMLRFNKEFEQEMKNLKTVHKIKIKAFFRGDSSLPNFKSEESMLKVYVSMTKDKCDPSNIKLEVVSLSVKGIAFEKLECKKEDAQCLDEKLSYVFENHVLGNIKEIESSPTAN